jgi:hypothetical protein
MARQQLLSHRASMLSTKRLALQLSACLEVWASAAQRRLQLRLLEQQGALLLRQRRLRAALVAWRRLAVRQHQIAAQEQYAAHFHAFMVLLKSMQRWKGYREHRQLKRLRQLRAAQQRRGSLLHAALLAWRQHTARSLDKWQQLATALSFQRQYSRGRTLRAWLQGCRAQQGARARAELRFASIGRALAVMQAADCFQDWRAGLQWQRFAARQLQQAAQRRLQRTRQLVLAAWRARVRRRQAAAAGGAALAALPAKWRLRHAMDRLQLFVAIMQASGMPCLDNACVSVRLAAGIERVKWRSMHGPLYACSLPRTGAALPEHACGLAAGRAHRRLAKPGAAEELLQVRTGRGLLVWAPAGSAARAGGIVMRCAAVAYQPLLPAQRSSGNGGDIGGLCMVAATPSAC